MATSHVLETLLSQEAFPEDGVPPGHKTTSGSCLDTVGLMDVIPILALPRLRGTEPQSPACFVIPHGTAAQQSSGRSPDAEPGNPEAPTCFQVWSSGQGCCPRRAQKVLPLWAVKAQDLRGLGPCWGLGSHSAGSLPVGPRSSAEAQCVARGCGLAGDEGKRVLPFQNPTAHHPTSLVQCLMMLSKGGAAQRSRGVHASSSFEGVLPWEAARAQGQLWARRSPPSPPLPSSIYRSYFGNFLSELKAHSWDSVTAFPAGKPGISWKLQQPYGPWSLCLGTPGLLGGVCSTGRAPPSHHPGTRTHPSRKAQIPARPSSMLSGTPDSLRGTWREKMLGITCHNASETASPQLHY
nr:uncharacterized protein LOC105731829 [Aotus nancymaae]